MGQPRGTASIRRAALTYAPDMEHRSSAVTSRPMSRAVTRWTATPSNRSRATHVPSMDQGVHDEDDRDDGEEDAVDVHFWQIVGRVIDPLLALPFPDVIVILCEPCGIPVRVVAAHGFLRQVSVSIRTT